MKSNGSLLITYQVRSHSLKCLLHFNFIRFLPLEPATFSLSFIEIIFNPTAGSLAKTSFLWLLFLQYYLSNQFYALGFTLTVPCTQQWKLGLQSCLNFVFYIFSNNAHDTDWFSFPGEAGFWPVNTFCFCSLTSVDNALCEDNE